jgi:hypothetical protein
MKRQSPFFLEPEIADIQQFQPRPILGKDISPYLNPDENYYTHEDIFEQFDRLLLSHYGEAIRNSLNASRAKNGWKPL